MARRARRKTRRNSRNRSGHGAHTHALYWGSTAAPRHTHNALSSDPYNQEAKANWSSMQQSGDGVMIWTGPGGATNAPGNISQYQDTGKLYRYNQNIADGEWDYPLGGRYETEANPPTWHGYEGRGTHTHSPGYQPRDDEGPIDTLPPVKQRSRPGMGTKMPRLQRFGRQVQPGVPKVRGGIK